MQLELLRDGADGVSFGAWLFHYSSPIATLGFSGFICAYFRSNSFVSSDITFGKTPGTSTNSSACACGSRREGAPRRRRRNFCPDCAPGAIGHCALPYAVGTSSCAPSAKIDVPTVQGK